VRDATAGGRAAILVPPDDVEALVAAIERIPSDRELSSRLAAAGTELARSHSLERSAAAAASFVRG
jgi:glycosyltransferase involved in cell wall biosynthesis